jgi:hypothetical protein
MGLKGYRLWAMGQLDSNVQSPTSNGHVRIAIFASLISLSICGCEMSSE